MCLISWPAGRLLVCYTYDGSRRGDLRVENERGKEKADGAMVSKLLLCLSCSPPCHATAFLIPLPLKRSQIVGTFFQRLKLKRWTDGGVAGRTMMKTASERAKGERGNYRNKRGLQLTRPPSPAFLPFYLFFRIRFQ